MADYTRTYDSKVQSATKRTGDKYRDAQRRLADKSFASFVREHNSRVSKG